MRPQSPLPARGFTLIELMIVVAIVGILAAVALPSYRDYVVRGYVVDATSLLSTNQAMMERYFQDNRTYAAVGTVAPPCAGSPVQGKFTLSCTTSASAYAMTATGTGPVAGFAYTVDQLGNKTSTFTAPATGWTSSTSCWVMKKGQSGC